MKKFSDKFVKGTGVMFHHFHDNKKNLKSQGSISKFDLLKIIKYIGVKNILTPFEFQKKIRMNRLKKGESVLTFDDGIKSQVNVALPILNRYNLKAFFFVNSSVFSNKKCKLELYRHIRNNEFKSVEDFYKMFFSLLNEKYKKIIFDKNILNNPQMNKKLFPYYTDNDIRFRVLRDNFLPQKEYENIMLKIIKLKKLKANQIYSKVYFSKNDLKKIHREGHVIGLHSFSHKDKIELLSKKEKHNEYRKDINNLSNILGINKDKIFSMSHPNGSFDTHILKYLKKKKISIGFMQVQKTYYKLDNKIKKFYKNLMLPREDHSIILKFIKNEK